MTFTAPGRPVITLDLLEAQTYYRQRLRLPLPPPLEDAAHDVLLGLTRYAPQLDELARDARERPQTRFPVNWTQRPTWGIRLPYYNLIQGFTSTLRLRAVAELAVGRTADARRDVDLMFHLRQAMEHDPNVIPILVDANCLNRTMQPVWEGLAARRWTAADLDALRDHLRGINVLDEYRQAIRGERASFQARWPEDLADPAQARALAKEIPATASDDPTLTPLDRQALAAPTLLAAWLVRAKRRRRRPQFPGELDRHRRPCQAPGGFRQEPGRSPAMKNIPATPYTLLVRIALPVFDSIYSKFAQTQTMVDQADTACALERYYLDHHSYPDALSALVPGYLDRVPNDVIDGAPMRYRADDRRTLPALLGRPGRPG